MSVLMLIFFSDFSEIDYCFFDGEEKIKYVKQNDSVDIRLPIWYYSAKANKLNRS